MSLPSESAAPAGVEAAAPPIPAIRMPHVWWDRTTSVLYPLLTLVGLIVLWELAVIVFKPAPYLVPKPTDLIDAADRNLPVIRDNVWVTVKEIALGYALAIIVGIPLAVAIVSSRLF